MRLSIAILVFLSMNAFAAGRALCADAPEAVEAVRLGHKEAGDSLAAKEDYKAAAAEYSRALSLDGGAFTMAERVRMAKTMAWGGLLRESIGELEKIKAEDPSNIEARKDLARVLSWDGKLDRAGAEIGSVLAERPGDTEALLIKASILNWKGRTSEAVSLYESVLEMGEDFDARAGLTYALLKDGRYTAATESKKELKPAYPYQERELEELERAVSSAVRPAMELSSSYYNDSDSNQVRRYSLAYGFLVSDLKAEIRYRHTDAEDASRDSSAEGFSLTLGGRVSEGVRARAGIGASFKGNGGFLTGRLSAETGVYGWKAVAGVSREMLTDTAQLIENGIRFSDYSVAASRGFGRADLSASYSFRHYSDGSSANDFSVTPKYAVMPGNPRVDIGYRFRRLDFDGQSGGGYFDPDDFISHQALVMVYYEKAGFYASIEPYYGHQAFERNGASTEDFFGGGSGVVGYRAGVSALELSAERGNYAVGGAAGFEYYMLGIRLLITL